MSETRCTRIKLKPGMVPRVREWARELNARMDEVLATLEDEGVNREIVFLEEGPDGDYLIYFMDAEDFEKGHQVSQASTHPIDAYHRKFKDEAWDTRQNLELLMDAVRTKGP